MYDITRGHFEIQVPCDDKRSEWEESERLPGVKTLSDATRAFNAYLDQHPDVPSRLAWVGDSSEGNNLGVLAVLRESPDNDA